MDRFEVVRRLREEEKRVATGWAGRRGQEDPAAALRELLPRQREAGGARATVRIKQEDPYMRAFFMTMCRLCGLEPFRKARQRRTTMMVEGPESVLQDVFWPLYQASVALMQDALASFFYGIASEYRVHAEAGDDELVDED